MKYEVSGVRYQVSVSGKLNYHYSPLQVLAHSRQANIRTIISAAAGVVTCGFFPEEAVKTAAALKEWGL